VGDVVLLQDDSVVPCKWPLTRVVETHAGRDGIIRIVTVKTATGNYKRPVTKLLFCYPGLLPVLSVS